MGCGTLTTIILNQLPGLRDECIQVFKLNVTCAHDSNFFLICTKLSSFLSHIEGIDIRMSHIEERFDHELALPIGCCIQMPGIV